MELQRRWLVAIAAAALLSLAASYVVFPSPGEPSGWEVYYRNDPAVNHVVEGTDGFEVSLDITPERYRTAGQGPIGTYRAPLMAGSTYVLEFAFHPDPDPRNVTMHLRVPGTEPGASAAGSDLGLGCEAGATGDRNRSSDPGHLRLNTTEGSCTYELRLDRDLEVEDDGLTEIGWEVQDADEGLVFETRKERGS